MISKSIEDQIGIALSMNDLSILFKDMGLYADALRNSITAAYLFYKLDLPQESNALVGSLEIIESFEKQEVVEKIFAEMCKF